MGLTKDSLREDQTAGALSGLLYAYELIGNSRKRLTHVRGEVWHEQVLEGSQTHKLFIETRKGEAVRCLSYCPARSFCNEAGKMEQQDSIPF